MPSSYFEIIRANERYKAGTSFFVAEPMMLLTHDANIEAMFSSFRNYKALKPLSSSFLQHAKT